NEDLLDHQDGENSSTSSNTKRKLSSEELSQIWNDQKELDDESDSDLFLNKNDIESESDEENINTLHKIRLIAALLD
ncbi:33550_t:CDS:2, partial [Gigaspora margarita]